MVLFCCSVLSRLIVLWLTSQLNVQLIIVSAIQIGRFIWLFIIELYLKHYTKALESLCLCKPLGNYAVKATELIEQKHLYQPAIHLFDENTYFKSYLNQIYSLYGDNLLAKKYFAQALIVFKKGENYPKPIKAVQLTNNWNVPRWPTNSSSNNRANQRMNARRARLARQKKPINLTKIYQSVAEQLDSPRDSKNFSFVYGFISIQGLQVTRRSTWEQIR